MHLPYYSHSPGSGWAIHLQDQCVNLEHAKVLGSPPDLLPKPPRSLNLRILPAPQLNWSSHILSPMPLQPRSPGLLESTNQTDRDHCRRVRPAKPRHMTELMRRGRTSSSVPTVLLDMLVSHGFQCRIDSAGPLCFAASATNEVDQQAAHDSPLGRIRLPL